MSTQPGSAGLPSNQEFNEYLSTGYEGSAMLSAAPEGASSKRADHALSAEPAEQQATGSAALSAQTTPGSSAQSSTSYKSPSELLSAPSSGKVTIAGRRLATGEIVQPEVIHLQDYKTEQADEVPRAASSEDVSITSAPMPRTAKPVSAAAPADPISAAVTVQETTRTSEQVYVTHGTVAAAAAAAGGLVGATHVDVRTAANVAEAAVDPAAVVDFDCSSPAGVPALQHKPTLSVMSASSADTHPALDQQSAPSSSTATATDQAKSPGQQVPPTAAAPGSDSTATGAALSAFGTDPGEPLAGHAVLPEDRQEVAATLQRLRSAGMLQGPPSTPGSTAALLVAADEADTFIGCDTAPSNSSAATGVQGSTVQPASISPSAQGVSAGTAAPALAGYPDPHPDTAAEQHAPRDESAPQHAALQPTAGSSSGLLAMHDAAARAAAVAGALVHIGQPVTTAAALAGTATQPAQAVDAAATAAGHSSGSGSTSSMTTRTPSLHQQHTLAEFLLDAPAAAAMSSLQLDGSSSTGHADAANADAVDVTLNPGPAAANDDLQVQLDVGRSNRLLSPDGSVAAAAATVPQEAVAAVKMDPTADASAGSSNSTPRSPRHPSLRQLSLSRQAGQGVAAADGGDMPYGLTVADIVAATIAAEERRFRVVSPRSSAGGNFSPRSGASGADSFFTASSSSTPASPDAEAASGSAAAVIERSSSPLSASATRAIFDTVQLAVQQQQHQEQLATHVARSASASLSHQHTPEPAASAAPAGSTGTAAATTARATSMDTGDSTATSSRSAGSAGALQARSSSAAAVENAEVMQRVLLQELASSKAVSHPAGISAGGDVAEDTLSAASTASQLGDSESYIASVLGSSSFSAAPGSSSNVSTGDRVAEAVAAGAADGVAAAARGADVAATVAPAFPAALFGPMPLPVDVPAAAPGSPAAPASAGSTAEQAAAPVPARQLATAAALADSGMAALSTNASTPTAAMPAQQKPSQVDSTAITSAALTDAAAATAAAAAAAATEMHAHSPDPSAAAADAAQLVVEAAMATPGDLALGEVASAAAAAGAAAASAAMPGMDAATAAVACAAAAAAPLTDPADVAAAAAQAVLDLHDSAVSAADSNAPAFSTAMTSSGAPTFAPMPAASTLSAEATQLEGSAAVLDTTDQPGLAPTPPLAPAPVASLSELLPILAPSGLVGGAVPVAVLAEQTVVPVSVPEAVGVSTSSTAAASPSTGQLSRSAAAFPAPERLASVPHAVGVQGQHSKQRSQDEAPAPSAAGTEARAKGTAEVLSTEGLSKSKVFDPLVVQLAMANSAPLEGLGLDAAHALDVSGAMPGLGRYGSSTGSLSRGLSGMLLMQQHPLAAVDSLGISSALEAGPAEGSTMLTHLAAADMALSKLDSKLLRQRTDSISLGGGQSAAIGEMDSALAGVHGTAVGAATAEAPAGPMGAEGTD